MPVALVTGASRGIGRAIAQLLSRNGWSIAVNYLHNDKAAQEVAFSLRYHAPALHIKADISDPEAVQQMIQTIHQQLGSISLLVNNAGITQISMIQDTTPVQWQRMLDTNLSGAFYCAQAVLPDMLTRQQGCIINISSMWGQVGASCEVAYSTAKAGIIGMTKAMAKELGPSGIRVNAITPGVIDTDMNKLLDPETLKMLKAETPLERLGTAHDVAQAVLYLTEASFVTGQILGVNGGYII